ncbi:MAG: hypothetical protein ACREK8_01800 [Gemmatimonadales bacterium]
MSRVALVYDQSCPHVTAARDQIRAALSLAGLPARWDEWDRDSRETPEALRPFGSPTILVDGRDVAASGDEELALPTANSCRVYVDDAGLVGVPPARLIVGALAREARS